MPIPVWESTGCLKLNQSDCGNWYELKMQFGWWIYTDTLYEQTANNCEWNGTYCVADTSNECDYGQVNVSHFFTTTTLCKIKIDSNQEGIYVCNDNDCNKSYCFESNQDQFLTFKYSGLSESILPSWKGMYTGAVFFLTLIGFLGIFGFVLLFLIWILSTWWKR
jgi:hypothetical protein